MSNELDAGAHAPPQVGRLKLPTPDAIYNAVRFEILRQQYRPRGAARLDRADPVDWWRWLHIARELSMTDGLDSFGFRIDAPGVGARCCAPTHRDGRDPCGARAKVEVWPAQHTGTILRVPLCTEHLTDLRAAYPRGNRESSGQ